MQLHLQALIEGSWQRAAQLDFPTAAQGRRGGCTFEYEYDYMLRWITDPPPLVAVSLGLPVQFNPTVWRRWPAFLDDLQPMGSARRWWLRRLGLADETASPETAVFHPDNATSRALTVSGITLVRVGEPFAELA